MTTPLRGTAALTAAVTLSLVLAACGEDAGTDTAGSAPVDLPTAAEQVEGPNNEADIAFAQGMIPHHRQAVVMSEVALERSEDPELRALAEEVRSAQEPEIRTMSAFLGAWGAEVPGGMSMEGMSTDGMSTDGMSMEGMAGMMSPEDMAGMEAMAGSQFDRMWLEMMIEHHEGAVEMAETQLDEGQNAMALELAAAIIEVQQSEIEQMRAMLDS